ncbi:MAG: AsmA-like C-terminal region-containing protein, partial [Flavitalea sp.]
MLKKILKISGIVLLVLILAAIAIPYFFKGKIMTLVKTEINKSVNAKVDFSDVDISFFRHFPRVAVALENLQVIGINEFSKDTLISAKDIDVAVNIMSIIRGTNMNIYSVTVDEPRIRAIVTKEGKANYDITKPDTATVQTPSEEKPFNMELQHYAIKNGYLYYNDASSDMGAEITNLNHEGSGDFTSDLFTLATNTTADEVSFNYGGVPYLYKSKTSIDAAIEIDNKANKYTFNTEQIQVNDMKLSAGGFFAFVNDSVYSMDIKFNAPSTEFKTLLSLVPAVYKNDFNKIETKGKAIFNGFVRGVYSSTAIPAYSVNLEVKDGFFKYPDLPKPVQNINIKMKVDNPDGVTDNTVVDIQQGHIEMDNEPFDFKVLFKKPLTDMYVDAVVKGKLDLSKITQFVKLEAGIKLAGLVNADLQAKGNVAAIQKQQPGPFSAKGFIDISKLYYASSAFPQPIQNTNARIEIESPDGVADHTVIKIPAAHVEVGKDPFDITLLLTTPTSDPQFDGTAKGSFNLGNVGQFYTFEPGTSLAGQLSANVSFKGKKSMIDKSQYDAIQTAGTANLSNIDYKSKDYPDGVKISSAALTFNPKNVTLNSINGNFMQTNFNASGSFDNLIGYAMKDEPLAGTLNVSADKVNLNKWMSTDTVAAKAPATSGSGSNTAGATESSEPFAVPANIKFLVNAKVDQVSYDKVNYNNVSGTLALANQTVTMKDLKMQALDGTIGLNGSYSTAKSKTHPDISLSYDVANLDVQKTFNAFNTVQSLMPIAKFVSGKLTSKLTMKGRLGEDMSPDLGSLTGEGTLFLLDGFLAKFAPLEKLASTLNINDLKSISVRDIKNYIEFANGKVLVKPFTVKVKDVDMEIGGMHGFDQSLDYIINMKVPRSLIGEKGNQLINGLVSQANNKGVPVKLSDVINLKVNMGGTISNPAIKTDLKQASASLAEDIKAQANEFVEAKKAAADSAIAVAKQQVKDSVESAKKQLAKAAQEELRKQLAGGKKDSTGKPVDAKKQLEETGKGLLKGLL